MGFAPMPHIAPLNSAPFSAHTTPSPAILSSSMLPLQGMWTLYFPLLQDCSQIAILLPFSPPLGLNCDLLSGAFLNPILNIKTFSSTLMSPLHAIFFSMTLVTIYLLHILPIHLLIISFHSGVKCTRTGIFMFCSSLNRLCLEKLEKIVAHSRCCVDLTEKSFPEPISKADLLPSCKECD